MTPKPADGPDSGSEITVAMAVLYDAYYKSMDYSRRYPKPNRSTWKLLMNWGADEAESILDFGSGNGRYTLPLLQQTRARVTAYDISHEAIAELGSDLQNHPLAARATLLCGAPAQLDGSGPYDLVVLLFGVLGHVGEHADRIRILKQLRALMSARGRLILSVPNILRRRPRDFIKAALNRATGKATPIQSEPGNILFTRRIANADREIFYHLYSVRGISRELKEAGFAVRLIRPESLLPEWMITQFDWLGALDAALLSWLPAWLGYCICVVAEPA
jgi:SAM-dependent methyltransferase